MYGKPLLIIINIHASNGFQEEENEVTLPSFMGQGKSRGRSRPILFMLLLLLMLLFLLYLKVFYLFSPSCYSYIGQQSGPQRISLASPGCLNKGIAIHEMMHCAGFFHEQSRLDRDNYIYINWGNIRGGKCRSGASKPREPGALPPHSLHKVACFTVFI